MLKFQDKERIVEAAREKQDTTYKEVPIRLAADFSVETLKARRELQENIPSHENQRPVTKTTLPGKALNQDRRPNKEFPRQISLKEYTSTTPALQEKLKALPKERKGRKRER